MAPPTKVAQVRSLSSVPTPSTRYLLPPNPGQTHRFSLLKSTHQAWQCLPEQHVRGPGLPSVWCEQHSWAGTSVTQGVVAAQTRGARGLPEEAAGDKRLLHRRRLRCGPRPEPPAASACCAEGIATLQAPGATSSRSASCPTGLHLECEAHTDGSLVSIQLPPRSQ